MLRFRRKIWVALFFALISIGQGFALSYVMNLSQIHSMEYTESNALVPAYLLVCGHDLGKSLKENPAPSQKTHQELLSLRTDPFIPTFHLNPEPVFESLSIETFSFFLIQNYSFPPDRPPRAEVLSFS